MPEAVKMGVVVSFSSRSMFNFGVMSFTTSFLTTYDLVQSVEIVVHGKKVN